MATKWIPDTPVTQKVTPNFEKAVQTNEQFSVSTPEKPKQQKRIGLEDKYQDVYNAWQKKPDKRNTAALLKAVQPEIEKGMLANVGTGSPILKSRAKIIALEAIKRYDPKAASLGTHIINNMQSLKRVNRQQSQIIHVPERVFYDQSYLKEAETDFELEFGRSPTDEELADRTGLSMRRIGHIRKFHPGFSEGSLSTDDEDSEFSSAPAVLGRRDTAPFLKVVYDDADPIDKKIMEWSLGLNGHPVLPNKVIASRLRITPGAVSQRRTKIQANIDRVSNFG